MIVRRLVLEDGPRLAIVLLRFHSESVFTHRNLNTNQAAVTTANSLEYPDELPAFVAVLEGQVVGVLRGFITTCGFSGDKIANEEFLYVLPEHRASQAARMLLDTFEQWAKASGCQHVITGDSGTRDPRIAKMYKRRGYSVHATLFIKEIT